MATVRRDLLSVKVEPIARGNTLVFKTKGQKFRGVYVGARKTKWEGRELLIHSFTDSKGEQAEVWESAALRNLQRVIPGKVVEIQYRGKRKSKKGGRRYNDFLISVEAGGLRAERVASSNGSSSRGRSSRGRK